MQEDMKNQICDYQRVWWFYIPIWNCDVYSNLQHLAYWLVGVLISGIWIPPNEVCFSPLGGPGLVDPCEKKPVDTLATLGEQQREDITSSAQVKKKKKICFCKHADTFSIWKCLRWVAAAFVCFLRLWLHEAHKAFLLQRSEQTTC